MAKKVSEASSKAPKKTVEPEPLSTPEPTATRPRRLYRSRRDRMIGGVAGGMAEYFGMDSTLMRLIFILLILLPGIGILTYILAWVLIPEEPLSKAGAEGAQAARVESQDTAVSTPPRQALGLVLVGVGVFFLLFMLFDVSDIGRFWPVLLIIIGLAILFGRDRYEGRK